MIKAALLAASQILLGVSLFAQAQTVPRIDFSASCPIDVQKGVNHDCGFLVVWENRKTKKKTIRLPFIRLKTSNPKPKPDPVLYTAGGPGVSSLRRARGSEYLQAYMVQRDFIVFEQRGTTYAEPSLGCPEVDEAIRQNGLTGKSGRPALANQLEAVRMCRRRLVSSGVDLSAYNSRSSAADIEDLRKTLNIERWNLFGMSYSTRLMLNVMREYPAGIRSVVLDSVLPPSVNWDETGIDGVVRSLNVLFERCSLDIVCSKKYPGLKGVFYETVDRFVKNPLKITVKDRASARDVEVKIDGADLVSIAYDALNYPNAISELPAGIYELSKGEYKRLETYGNAKIDGDRFVWGMRYSVWCGEEMPFEVPDRIAAQKRRYARLGGFAVQSAFPAICKIWNVPAADPVENEPVVSEIPTLILAGSFDPNTPPEWGKLVSENLSHSFYYEYPDMGHLINFNSECGINMIGAFLIDPSIAPDSGCIAKEKRVVFR